MLWNNGKCQPNFICNCFKIKDERSLCISRIVSSSSSSFHRKYDNDAHETSIYTMQFYVDPKSNTFWLVIWNAHRKWIIFPTLIVFSVLVNSFVLKNMKRGKNAIAWQLANLLCFLFEHSVLHSFGSRHQKISITGWL